MATPTKRKTFKHKMAALLGKGKLSSTMLLAWHDRFMSSWHASQRYWIFVFTRPIDYKFQKNEQKWRSQIRVWDTHDEEWVNIIYLQGHLNSQTSYIHYDYKRQLIMCAVDHISGDYKRASRWLEVYGFFKKDVLCTFGITTTTQKPIRWKVTGEEVINIMFNDDRHLHEIIDLSKPNMLRLYSPHPNFKSIIDTELPVEVIAHPNDSISVIFLKQSSYVYKVVICYRDSLHNKILFTEKTSLQVKIVPHIETTVSIKDEKLIIGDIILDIEAIRLS